MIPEPHPYDPDDPTNDDPTCDYSTDELGYLLPDRSYRGALIDPMDPMEY